MRRGGLDTLGIIFGIVAFLIVIVSALLLISGRPFRVVRNFKESFELVGVMNWGREEETGEERITGDFSEIDISNISGDILVTGWNEDYYLLTYTKQAPSREHLDGLKVDIEQNDDELSIEREFEGSGISPRGIISFSLNFPQDKVTLLNAQSINGKIVCTNMTGSIDQNLHTTSGRIETDNSRDLFAKSISGSVDFIFNGRELEIRTTSGRIDGEVRSIDPRGKIESRSVSGAVRIAVPDDFSAKLDLRSVSGSVSTDFPIEGLTTKRNSLEGTIRDGKIPVNISTTSGSIRIRRMSGDE